MSSRIGGRVVRAIRHAGSAMSSRTTVMTVRGLRISVRVSSDIEEYRATTYESKEPETLDWIDRHVKPGDVLYDIGANIGLYSLYAAARGATVVAVEPEALNFAELNRNIVANKATSVFPICCAIGARLEAKDLFVRELSEGAACHALGEPLDQRGRSFQAAHRQGVIVVPLDALVDEFQLPAPNHVKIDVDGGEEAVLAGGKATIASTQLRSLLIEIVPGQEAMLQALASLVMETGRSSVQTSAEYPGVNYVFVRP